MKKTKQSIPNKGGYATRKQRIISIVLIASLYLSLAFAAVVAVRQEKEAEAEAEAEAERIEVVTASSSVSDNSNAEISEAVEMEETAENADIALVENTDVFGLTFLVPEIFETGETTTYSQMLSALLSLSDSSDSDEEIKAQAEHIAALPIRISSEDGYVYLDTSNGITLVSVNDLADTPENLSDMAEDDIVSAVKSTAINESNTDEVEFNCWNERTADKINAEIIYHYSTGEDELLVPGFVSIIRNNATGEAFILSVIDSSQTLPKKEMTDGFDIR